MLYFHGADNLSMNYRHHEICLSKLIYDQETKENSAFAARMATWQQSVSFFQSYSSLARPFKILFFFAAAIGKKLFLC